MNCIAFPLSLAQASLRNSGNFHAQFLFRAFSPPFGLTLCFSPLFAVLNCIAFPPSLAQASLRNSGMGIYLLWLRFSLFLLVKVMGIEPMSESISTRASPSAADDLKFRFPHRPTAGYAFRYSVYYSALPESHTEFPAFIMPATPICR